MNRTAEAAQVLREEISSGRFPEGDPFCSEHQLCARFSLSRMTVRNVLKLLEAEGLVYRIPKKGTFVTPRKRRERLEVALFVDKEHYLSSPFLARVLTGINRALAEDGFALSIPRLSLHEDDMGLSRPPSCGLILPGTFAREELLGLKNLGIPLVRLMDTEVAFPGCSLGLRRAANELTASLRRRGCRRFALLSGHGGFLDQEKERGIQDALAGGKLRPELDICQTGYDEREVAPAMERWFASRLRPDCIIAFDDTLALAALRWLRAQGISVPGKVKLAGFNDMEFCSVTQPALTSVALPVEAAAEAATRIAIDLAKTGKAKRAPKLCCSVKWRASTGDNQ